MFGPVPGHLSPGNLQRHRQLLTHRWANMSCSLYLFSSSLEWLLRCHVWQITITSVQCFWIHGWVPWAAPKQAFWIWLQGRHLSKQYWESLGSFWLTFDRFQGNKAMPAAASLLICFHQVDTLRIYLASSRSLPFLVSLLESWDSLFNLAVSCVSASVWSMKICVPWANFTFLCKLPPPHFIPGDCLLGGGYPSSVSEELVVMGYRFSIGRVHVVCS